MLPKGARLAILTTEPPSPHFSNPSRLGRRPHRLMQTLPTSGAAATADNSNTTRSARHSPSLSKNCRYHPDMPLLAARREARVWEMRARVGLKPLDARVVYGRKGMAESPAPPIDAEAFRPDARARALLRGVALAEEDLRASGGAYGLAEVRRLMRGISRQAIDKRVRDGSLLAVTGPSNRRSYPTVQFLGDGSVVDGLKQVRAVLATKNPWMLLNFLVNPEPRLDGRKPIELLKSGQIEPVVDAARRIGAQGA